MLLVAKLGGDLATRLGQPAVLGELLGGVLLGSLGAFGSALKNDAGVELISRIGAIVLLFEVGLESNIAEMRRVGFSALLVAIVGVVVPFALGFGVSRWL